MPVRPLRKSLTTVPLWQKLPERVFEGKPRTLIAISSCQLYENRGWHSVMRQTWLQEAERLGMDYKFFFGEGAREDRDVVKVDCDDRYFDLTNKLKCKLKWAAFQNYDFVFCCLADCYAAPERLVNSGYEKYDYFGDVFCHPGGIPYCQGGPGFFLSRAAVNVLNQCASSYPNEDCWVGDMLYGKPLVCQDSKDFVWMGHLPKNGPRKDNTHITAHLSNADGGYTPELMWEKHRQWTSS